MQNVQLPDGTWVTTPIAVGIGRLNPACEDGCRWEDFGPVTEEVPRVQMQRCSGCGQVRGRYLDDPSLVEDV
jgi:hypothetical protein